MIIYNKLKRNYRDLIHSYIKDNRVIQISNCDDITDEMLMVPMLSNIMFILKVETPSKFSDTRTYIKTKGLVDKKSIIFNLFLSPELYAKVSTEKKKSNYEEFRDYVIILLPTVSKNMLYQLYRRVGNDPDKLKELITVKGVKTVRDLNKVVPPDSTIYVSDFIDKILIKDRRFHTSTEKIQAMGEEFAYTLGKKYAYFTILKYLWKLYSNKVTLLKETSIKDKRLELKLSKMRVNELLYFYHTLLESSPEELNIKLKEVINVLQ